MKHAQIKHNFVWQTTQKGLIYNMKAKVTCFFNNIMKRNSFFYEHNLMPLFSFSMPETKILHQKHLFS